MNSFSRSRATVVVATTAMLLLACNVNVKKAEGGEEKKVDIQTPVGSLHVSKDADVKDVGLAVYPGARPKEKSDNGEEKNANVNISAGGFGLRVLAVEFESDDAPDKVLSFYSNELKKFGKVLQCQGTGDANASMDMSDSDSDQQLSCGDSKGSATELKVGSKRNQHIVSVKPQGKGSVFALVYLRTRGKDTI